MIDLKDDGHKVFEANIERVRRCDSVLQLYMLPYICIEPARPHSAKYDTDAFH
jgi:hypothetical protein